MGIGLHGHSLAAVFTSVEAVSQIARALVRTRALNMEERLVTEMPVNPKHAQGLVLVRF